MTINKRQVLIPEYLKNFTCIGTECENTCCEGWRVALDKSTYQLYKFSRNETLKPLFEKHIARQRSNQSDEAYARIKMDKEGKCPFLDEKSLCMIQLSLGPEALSETCAIYPRYTNQIDGKLERSTTMSCPEAARQALLNPRPMAFEIIEEMENIRQKINVIFDTEGHLFYHKPQRYFWDIRIFVISLLQDRSYALWERLIILGMFYQHIDKIIQETGVQDLPKQIAAFQKIISNCAMKNSLNQIQGNLEIQFQLLNEMIYGNIAQNAASGLYLECYQEMLKGLGYTKEQEIITMEQYKNAYENYYLPFMSSHDYLLEHYLVNEFFRLMMPFGQFDSIWQSYVLLVCLYGTIKMHLIGMAGYHQGLNEEQVIKLIHSLSKVTIHNQGYINSIVGFIESNGFDTLAYLSLMIKN